MSTPSFSMYEPTAAAPVDAGRMRQLTGAIKADPAIRQLFAQAGLDLDATIDRPVHADFPGSEAPQRVMAHVLAQSKIAAAGLPDTPGTQALAEFITTPQGYYAKQLVELKAAGGMKKLDSLYSDAGLRGKFRRTNDETLSFRDASREDRNKALGEWVAARRAYDEDMYAQMADVSETVRVSLQTVFEQRLLQEQSVMRDRHAVKVPVQPKAEVPLEMAEAERDNLGHFAPSLAARIRQGRAEPVLAV